jgi:ribosomal protein S18 acetylase RimI-like enzyme
LDGAFVRPGATAAFRIIKPDDVERCVTFGLEAFRPVFEGWEQQYGKPLFDALRPDWEKAQSDYIREACSSEGRETWVATSDGTAVGFIVLVPEPDTGLGRIELLAVDPEQMGHGVGTALNELAVERFRELGMSFVVLSTGTDPGHDPARRSYEKAGFTPMPIHPFHYVKRL